MHLRSHRLHRLADRSPLYDDLMSAWPLSYNGNDAYGSNHLTNNNAVRFVPRGPEGHTATFGADGSTGHLLTASTTELNLSPAIDWTVSYWHRVDSWTSGQNYLLRKATTDVSVVWSTGWQASTRPGFNLYGTGGVIGGTNVPANTCPLGTWYHYVVAYRASDRILRQYVNGVFHSASAPMAAADATTSNTPLYFGTRGTVNLVNSGPGQLARVGIWTTRELSASDVAELYRDGKAVLYVQLSTGVRGGIKSWWDLNENSDGSGAVSRLDSVGGFHLTDMNTMPSTLHTFPANIPGQVSSFVTALSQHFSRAALNALDGSRSMAIWFRPIAYGTTAAPIGLASTDSTSVAGALSSNPNWLMNMDEVSIRLYHADGYKSIPAVSLNAWHLVVMEYDAITDTWLFQLDGGAPQSGVALDTRTPISLFIGSGYNSSFGGQISSPLFWSAPLGAERRALLWNGGAGRFFPFV